MTKRYIICDEYSEYKEPTDYKGIKNLLIDEIERDLETNYMEKDVVLSDFKIMKRLATEEYTGISYIIEQLSYFGWYVMDLYKLQEYLMNYQAYKHGAGAPSYPNDCIQQTLDMIEKE